MAALKKKPPVEVVQAPPEESAKPEAAFFANLEYLDPNLPMNRKLKAIAERQLNKK